MKNLSQMSDSEMRVAPASGYAEKVSKILVEGHRGGFTPHNSIVGFKESIKHNLESIELDVWLT
jgi:glycerophosphoryl diester phosphodiesterase